MIIQFKLKPYSTPPFSFKCKLAIYCMTNHMSQLHVNGCAWIEANLTIGREWKSCDDIAKQFLSQNSYFNQLTWGHSSNAWNVKINSKIISSSYIMLNLLWMLPLYTLNPDHRWFSIMPIIGLSLSHLKATSILVYL